MLYSFPSGVPLEKSRENLEFLLCSRPHVLDEELIILWTKHGDEREGGVVETHAAVTYTTVELSSQLGRGGSDYCRIRLAIDRLARRAVVC